MFVSALFLLATTLAGQYIGSTLDTSFDILASKGPGKVLFILFMINSAALCMWLTGAASFYPWLKKNLGWLTSSNWLKPFFMLFTPFFILHCLILTWCVATGYATYLPAGWSAINFFWFARIGFGFLATLFLVFAEELVFRGTLYEYLRTYTSPLVAIFSTSLCFSLAHNVLAPHLLITHEWRLGLGLFLLGMMLNILYIVAGNLYTAMGAHAGLVFVKVILCRLPIISFAPAANTTLLFSTDLRQSLIVHGLLVLTSIILIAHYRKTLLFK